MTKSKGLGDTIEKVTKATGIKPLVEYITADILKVKDDANARFDAISRTYEYFLSQNKNL